MENDKLCELKVEFLNADEAKDGADKEGFSEFLPEFFLKILLHLLRSASSAFKKSSLHRWRFICVNYAN
jgi:hypothetical protein